MRSFCCTCCGDLHKLPLLKLQMWWSLVRSGAPRLPSECDFWHAMKLTIDSKVLTLLIVDRFLPLKFHNPIAFSLENYCSVCKVIAKTFPHLAEGTMALIFMAGCSYWLCKAKNKAHFEVTSGVDSNSFILWLCWPGTAVSSDDCKCFQVAFGRPSDICLERPVRACYYVIMLTLKTYSAYFVLGSAYTHPYMLLLFVSCSSLINPMYFKVLRN